MGTTINQLSAVDSVTAGDSVVIYAPSQGDARRATFTTILAYLASAFSSLTVSSYVKVTPVSFANLPSASSAGAGARAFITDGAGTTFNAVAAGGGANYVPVFSDGTDWRVG